MVLSCPPQKPQVFHRVSLMSSTWCFWLDHISQESSFPSITPKNPFSSIIKSKMQFLLPRTVTAAGQKGYESSLPVCYLTFPLILSCLVYHLLCLLCLRWTAASLGLEPSFTMGSVQHCGVLIYLRPLGVSVNKQHMLTGLQFQSTCMKVQESRVEASTRVLNREHFYQGEVMSIQRAFLRN